MGEPIASIGLVLLPGTGDTGSATGSGTIAKLIESMAAILGICIVFLIPCFYALKLEVSVGAYKCKNCGYKIVPTYKKALMSMHIGTTRHLKCPKCNKRTWCKKVLKK